MSTEYRTIPPIPYDRFLEAGSVVFMEAPKPAYTVDHKLVTLGGTYLYIRRGESGEVIFERTGINNVRNIFPAIIREFGVQVVDEFGLPWELLA